MTQTTVRLIADEGAALSDYVAAAEALLAVPEVAAALRLEKAMGVVTGARRAAPASQIAHRMEERLVAVVDGWEATTELARAAIGNSATVDWVQERVAKVRGVHEREARAALRDGYRQMWLAGRRAAGNEKPLGKDEINQLQKMQRRQSQYFLNFMDDIEQGVGRMDYRQRARRYPLVARQAYWAGYVLADLSPGRYLQWRLSEKAEGHCHDCPRLAAGGKYGNGVYRAQELARRGVFPGSGELQCCGGCGCDLHEIEAPRQAAGGPQGRVQSLRAVALNGPGSSSFSGMGRENRSRRESRVARYRWTHRGRSVKRGRPAQTQGPPQSEARR